MSTDEAVHRIAEKLAGAERAVAFTGAGISTESGIADFRSPGGVWSRYRTVYYDEFMASPRARQEYWAMKRACWPEFAAAPPNAGHVALAEWEKAGRLAGVITQNIDGLHQLAGSENVLELHGTQRFVTCVGCGKRWPTEVFFADGDNADADAREDEVPTCSACGGWLKPATVMFGQPLPSDVLSEATRLAARADLFLAMGSSLVVEPAASLPLHAKQAGAFLVIINRDETPADAHADLVLHTPIGETLTAIAGLLESYSRPHAREFTDGEGSKY